MKILLKSLLFAFCGIWLSAQPVAASALVETLAGAQDTMVLVIKKSAKTLTLYEQGKAVKDYRAVFGVNPDGNKVRQGDNRTPEGIFYITDKELLNNHPYLGRKWLGLSYPDVNHARRGLEHSMISYEQYDAIVRANVSRDIPPQNTALGGWIGIHGGREDLTAEGVNWTEGCIAMLDKDLEELYTVIKPGTKVIITA